MIDMEAVLAELREQKAERENRELRQRFSTTSFEEVFRAFSAAAGLFAREESAAYAMPQKKLYAVL